jgi:ketosteroid isomerase-like protein
METTWATPEAAEQAFYEAFEAGDLPAMMQVWADSADICCIHPMGKALLGPAAVREGWEGVFSSSQRLRFVLESLQWQNTGDLAISVLLEHIRVEGEARARPPMIATNIYRRTVRGWRMLLHHASPAVVEVAKDSQQVLH